MSDTPGGNFHPRDRRRKDRPRNRNRRPQAAQSNSGPPAPHPPREREGQPPDQGPGRRERKRNRDRDRSRGRDRDREHKRGERKPGGPGAAASTPSTLGQKLLRIFTFGLAGRKAASSAAPRQERSAAEAPKKNTTPVPPADPEAITSTRLHVGNLHYDIAESDLLDLFKGIGPVKSVDIVYNGRTYQSKGFGFVEFMSLEDARRAVTELHGQLYMRRPLLLGPARRRGEDEREADAAGD